MAEPAINIAGYRVPTAYQPLQAPLQFQKRCADLFFPLILRLSIVSASAGPKNAPECDGAGPSLFSMRPYFSSNLFHALVSLM